jgi:hypothetical protein
VEDARPGRRRTRRTAMTLKTAILAVEILACLAVGLAAVPLMVP